MKMIITLLTLMTLIVPTTQANTFIGNGGNAGDVELQVTLLQIKRSLTEIVEKKYKVNQLCTCDESMEGHKICDALKALTIEQLAYCEKTLVNHATEFLNFINGRAGVQILWTKEAIEVNELLGSREALAVTQPNEKTILLNREDFLNLRDYERIFLLTHELGHLVKIENHFLRDDEVIGPFKQTDGSRQLLNSIGAAVAMKSLTNDGIDDYKGSLRRSKNYKDNWFNLSLGADNAHSDKSAFNIRTYSGFDFSYRYQLTQAFGLSVGGRSMKGTETFFTQLRAENELTLWNAQMNYRLFPFKNPLTFWGQSHIVLGIGYEIGQGHMKLTDDFTSTSDQADISGGLFSVQYFIPLYVGIWLHGGVQLAAEQYEYKKLFFKSEANQIYFNLGASYAF